MTYSKLIGFLKTFKNGFIFYGIPAIALLIERQAEWVPAEYEVSIGVLLGAISYFIKNRKANK